MLATKAIQMFIFIFVQSISSVRIKHKAWPYLLQYTLAHTMTPWFLEGEENSPLGGSVKWSQNIDIYLRIN